MSKNVIIVAVLIIILLFCSKIQCFFFNKMVRTYKRKTPKRDPQIIVRALRAIQNGMSIRAASRDFGVCDRSLRRQLGINRRIVNENTVGELINSSSTKTIHNKFGCQSGW